MLTSQIIVGKQQFDALYVPSTFRLWFANLLSPVNTKIFSATLKQNIPPTEASLGWSNNRIIFSFKLS